MIKSKKVGDEAENEILQWLLDGGHNARKNLVHSLRYDYDIEVDIPLYSSHGYAMKHDKFTIEVKNDVMATKTGNVAIEYWNSRKNAPSGLTVTKANIWAHKIDGEVWICSVPSLKKFVETNKPLRIIEGGGDDNADLYLYKIEDFISNCIKLKEISHAHQLYDLCM